MGVHVLWRKEEGVELRLTFQSVSDPLRSSLGKAQGQLQCQISRASNLWVLKCTLDWSLQSLFDRNIERSCPVAQTSQILVSLPRDTAYSLTPVASSIERDFAVFDVNTSMSYA